jgi:hypothetical protein
MTNDQSPLLLCRPALWLMPRLPLMAAYSGGEAIVQQLRARQRHRVGCVAHLVDAELPLHEGDDLPVVEVGED